MKKLNVKLILVALTTSLTFISCYDKFEPDSYKPPLDIAGFTSSNEIAPANLIAYWGFDGNLTDSKSGTAGENTGTSFAPGFKLQGLQGAMNSYVLATPSPAVTGMSSFTITYWVNSPAPSSGIIGLVNLAKTDGFWGNIDMFFENGSSNTDGKFRAHITNGTLDKWVNKDGLVGLHENKWVAVGLSYDEATGTFKLYINGSAVTTVVDPAFGPISFTNIGKLVFGAVQFQTVPSQTTGSGSQPWASYLTGRIDEVRIWNKALLDTEVSALVLLEGRGK